VRPARRVRRYREEMQRPAITDDVHLLMPHGPSFMSICRRRSPCRRAPDADGGSTSPPSGRPPPGRLKATSRRPRARRAGRQAARGGSPTLRRHRARSAAREDEG
jgi:hypothetical protein